jgi:hypothetical protein
VEYEGLIFRSRHSADGVSKRAYDTVGRGGVQCHPVQCKYGIFLRLCTGET